MTKIDKKIVGCSVVDKSASPAPAIATATADVVHEKLARPECLAGRSYKVKTPMSDHALYITINDVVLNRGTEDEVTRPFEIFINCKDMAHFQWIVALARIISAVFRKGGEVTFLVDELRSVFDPKGGYFKKGGKFMPSLVAEIGDVLEQHLAGLGMIERDDSLAIAAQAMVAEKTAGNGCQRQCAKCGEFAVVVMDGCMTCTACGDSKCG